MPSGVLVSQPAFVLAVGLALALSACRQSSPAPAAPEEPATQDTVADECRAVPKLLGGGCTDAGQLGAAIDQLWTTLKQDTVPWSDIPYPPGSACQVAELVSCEAALRPGVPATLDPAAAAARARMLARLAQLVALPARDRQTATAYYLLAWETSQQDLDPLAWYARLVFWNGLVEESLVPFQELERIGLERKAWKHVVMAQEFQGRALTALGKLDEAKRILEVSTRLYDEHSADVDKYWGCPFQALGELYGQIGNPQERSRLLVRAADIESNSWASQFEASISLFALGKYDDALKYLERARKLENSPGVAVAEGRIRARMAEEKASGKPAPGDGLAFDAAQIHIKFPGNELNAPLQYVRMALAIRQDPEYARLEKKLAYGEEGGDPFSVAIVDYENGDYGKAASVLESLLKEAPTSESLVLHGLLLQYERKYDEAAAALDRAAVTLADDPGIPVVRGHLAIAKREYDVAEKLLTPALERLRGLEGPTSTRYSRLMFRMAALGLGWAAANRSRHEEAIEYFQQVLKGRKDDLFALLGKGNSLSGLKRLDEAKVIFEQILKTDPHNPYALAELGLVDYNEGRLEQAEQRFQKALAREDQRYTCPYEGLGLVYLKQGRHAEAKRHFEKAIDINPNIEFKKFNGLAKIYLQQGDYEKARELLTKSIQNYPYDTEAAELMKKLPPPGTAKAAGTR